MVWTYVEDYEEMTGKTRETGDVPAQTIREVAAANVATPAPADVTAKVLAAPSAPAAAVSAVKVETA